MVVELAAPETIGLNRPHGGALVDRTGDRPAGVDRLERGRAVVARAERSRAARVLVRCRRSRGSWGETTTSRVLESMRLVNGLPWALPVCLAVDPKLRAAIASRSSDPRRAAPVGVLEVEDWYAYDKEREAERVFRTTESGASGRRAPL